MRTVGKIWLSSNFEVGWVLGEVSQLSWIWKSVTGIHSYSGIRSPSLIITGWPYTVGLTNIFSTITLSPAFLSSAVI